MVDHGDRDGSAVGGASMLLRVRLDLDSFESAMESSRSHQVEGE